MLYCFVFLLCCVALPCLSNLDVQYCLQVSTGTMGFPIFKDCHQMFTGTLGFPMEL